MTKNPSAVGFAGRAGYRFPRLLVWWARATSFGERTLSPLADLAVRNFIEMRDKTASRLFRWKKKLDHALEAALPGMYLPLYAMVTFTRIPYSAAAKRARLQDRILYAAGIILLLIVLLIVAFLFARL